LVDPSQIKIKNQTAVLGKLWAPLDYCILASISTARIPGEVPLQGRHVPCVPGTQWGGSMGAADLQLDSMSGFGEYMTIDELLKRR
jgi:hypothetical protein